MSSRNLLTRRNFLQSTTVAGTLLAVPAYVPAAALGAEARSAPSQRINVGMIGLGRQAQLVNLRQFLGMPDVQIVAVCDVDAWRLETAQKTIEAAYAKPTASATYRGCDTYLEFRDLLARKDIDAVMISAPDHWHAPMALAAMEAGKDVSLEKPITRTIAEGRQLADTAKRLSRVFRVDSEFRSLAHLLRACELVRNGRIGKLHTIRTGVPAGDNVDCPYPDTVAMPVPKNLDYERWQGPAPRAAYHVDRVHPPGQLGRPGWMRVLTYSDGMVTNWGAHLNDIAQWGNDSERTGPVEIEGHGVSPPTGRLWNVLKTFEIQYRFADGVRLFYQTDKPYVRFEGSEGWIQADYPQGLAAEPAAVLDAKIGPDGIHFPLKSDKQDFIDAVKTRGHTLEDAEVGHRTTSLCHLGHIAIRVGGKLQWDPKQERFLNSDAANAWIDKPLSPEGKT
ncbi:MAG: Gfo/Idh/MocA family oxidoreductase [Planctomycetota bacterium]|nr:Gfo/Idh/MocA family oxidoreductase [Planctomycetota bacterium]